MAERVLLTGLTFAYACMGIAFICGVSDKWHIAMPVIQVGVAAVVFVVFPCVLVHLWSDAGR